MDYWLDWVLVMAAETAAAAVFLQYWFPAVPVWLLSLLVSIAITAVNLSEVNVYGETEYWLAGVKIAVLILFILLGGTLIFSGFGGPAGASFSNLTAHGGFLPHGMKGLAAAMLVVMFSFGGIEMIGMTLGETEHPKAVISRAAGGVIFRILTFYVLPILVIVSLVPWNQLDTAESPFVSVFRAVHIPYVGGIMNFVMLTAVLSATNTGMYSASRMLYTQALEGQAPRVFAKLSGQKVPVRALLASTSFLYLGVIIAFFAKGQTFDYLMVIPGYSVMLVWILLTAAHMRSLKNRTSLTSWIALILLIVIFISVVITSPWMGTLLTALAIGVIVVTYRMRRRAES